MPTVGVLARLDQLQHSQVVCRRIGHRGNFDDICIELGHPLVDCNQVSRRFAKIMQADNSLCLTESRNRGGNVLFDIHIVDTFRNGHPQNRLAGLFISGILAPILLSATSGNHRSWSFAEQLPEVDVAFNVIQSQFHQFGTLSYKVLVFCNHVSMATAPNRYTNHLCFLFSWARAYGIVCMRVASPLLCSEKLPIQFLSGEYQCCRTAMGAMVRALSGNPLL